MKELMLPDWLEKQRQYGQFWDFTEQPPAFAVPLNPVTAGANANDDVAATLVGVVPRAARLIGGYGAVSANSAGIDANNTSAWVVSVGGVTAMTKTNTANLVADTPVSLGTPAITDCAAGAAIKLAITNGANADLNSATCLVTLAMADASCFPAPGLKVIATDGGTCTIADGVDGYVAISPGAADNNEIYLCGATEIFKFADGKPQVFETLLQFTEASTNKANVIAGLIDAVAANTLQDDGAGPKATFSGAVFYKIDGETTWRVRSSVGTTAVSKTLDADGSLDKIAKTAGGSAYQILRIEVKPESSTKAWVDYFLGTRTAAGDWAMTHVAHSYLTITSATEMMAVVGMKNGSANRETLNIEYMGAEQLR
jgi:hypothetical protein